MRRGWAIAALAAVTLLLVLAGLACGSDEPWLNANGDVGAQEVDVGNRGHCGWDSATFLKVRYWSTYVRDPKGVVPGKSGPYLAKAELPADAAYAGIHRGKTEIWESAAVDPDAIFVVFPNHTERWPLTTAQCGD